MPIGSNWQEITYQNNGTIVVGNLDRNQPVQGNGRYAVPRRWGGYGRRIDLASDGGSVSTIFDIKWYEPWRGHL